MASRLPGADIWDEIIETEMKQKDEIAVVYNRRKKVESNLKSGELRKLSFGEENRVSWVPVKRISLNRALSTRGRTSIAVATFAVDKPQQKNQKKKQKPPLPRGKAVQPANFDKEREYFQEVDSFELLEESPSPKKTGTWAMGGKSENIVLSHLSSVLQKWLLRRRLNHSCGPSTSLSTILGTPTLLNGVPCDEILSIRTPEKGSAQIHSGIHPIQERFNSIFSGIDVSERCIPSRKNSEEKRNMGMEGSEDIELAIRNLSLASRSSLSGHLRESSIALLTVCGQTAPSTLFDVFSTYCDPESIAKIGEGTFGEAFKAGKTVCKVVPFDGDLRVNGEVQKRAEELFEEVVLSLTLNRLRGPEGVTQNSCTTFIEIIDVKVCEGPYDSALTRAWEQWDSKHGSENDHPKEFQEKQCYVVFVQEHGGQDLESFVLLNFDEARSLLVQVTVAFAVAETAYEFEHRDLHWGNILLSRKESATLQFILEGKKIEVRTFGLLISIIDFTLSRINTGEDILFLDLSSDPEIFGGPKGDKQSETYRRMKEVTDDCWEESFPKTNVLWLQYLVDILLTKKTFDRTTKDERELRSLKKRLNNYDSAKEAISDPFFEDLFC